MGNFNVPQNIIKIFKYENNNEVSDIKLNIGDNWDDVKTNNSTINSIFQAVDDGDGIVQAKELNALNKIFLYIEKLVDINKNNGVLNKNELDTFEEKLNSGEIKLNDIINQKEDSGVSNWSECLNRNITNINIATSSAHCSYNPRLKRELTAIGKEQGFTVTEIESGNDVWVEDSSIRRHDGKRYVSMYTCNVSIGHGDFTNSQGIRSMGGSGRVFDKGNAFDLEIDNSVIYYGTSYLEGGNVLNTLSKDGKPSAIIGESSIAQTLDAMGLENTPENITKAKLQIAEDLGLNPNDVTFIPQYDFHIDMLYHPLSNGKIAIPDFDEAIRLFEENNICVDADQKDERLTKLRELKNRTATIRNEAENRLQLAGYELVKIPCFTIHSKDHTNFMNGVGGTSNKTGETFYITNKSLFKGLDKIMEPYFKNAGIDRVYYVSTTKYLMWSGGIDCLTQEE